MEGWPLVCGGDIHVHAWTCLCFLRMTCRIVDIYFLWLILVEVDELPLTRHCMALHDKASHGWPLFLFQCADGTIDRCEMEDLLRDATKLVGHWLQCDEVVAVALLVEQALLLLFLLWVDLVVAE